MPATLTRLQRIATAIVALVITYALTLIAFAPPAAAAPRQVTIGNLIYSIDTDLPGAEATLTGFVRSGLPRDLTIPGSIEVDGQTYTVSTIGPNALRYATVNTLALEDGIRSIGTNAFASLRVTSVSLPQSLIEIGESAFQGNSLTSINLPSSLTTIGTPGIQEQPPDRRDHTRKCDVYWRERL